MLLGVLHTSLYPPLHERFVLACPDVYRPCPLALQACVLVDCGSCAISCYFGLPVWLQLLLGDSVQLAQSMHDCGSRLALQKGTM